MVKISKFLRFGAPMIVLCVAGSFGLKEFTSLKYQYGKQYKKTFVKELIKETNNIEVVENVTLESVFDEIKEIDTTNWTNKRGPRPWEENNELYLEGIERAKKIKKFREKSAGTTE